MGNIHSKKLRTGLTFCEPCITIRMSPSPTLQDVSPGRKGDIMSPVNSMREEEMGRVQPDPHRSSQPHRFPASRPGSSEFIRAAERFVQARNYTLALDQLTQAQTYDPDNKYIGAIIERVLTLQRSDLSGTSAGSQDHADSSPDPRRYLSITVGTEFDNGVRPPAAGPAASEDTYSDLVKEFTRIAHGYARLGLPEAAFDALMKAYLIDPINPDVIECEKEVVPLWNQSRQNGAPAAPPAATTAPTTRRNPAPSERRPDVASDTWGHTRGARQIIRDEEAELRLEVLKQDKELERREKERAMWREASKPPNILQNDTPDQSDLQADSLADGASKARGLLRRFRKRKTDSA